VREIEKRVPTWSGGEVIPMRRCALALVIVVFGYLLADAANAQSSGRGGADVRAIRGGYCPTGTCNIIGGRWAVRLANCKAAHCR
jgi:hypothetical protein